MIKVLTILSGLDGGGIETILLNYLHQFDLKNIQMDIIVHSKEIGFLEEEYQSLGCKICRVTPKSKSIVKNYFEIKKIIEQGNYNIVHSRMNYKGLTHMLAAYACGVPVRIIHNHQANMEKNYSYFSRKTINILRKITMLLANNYMACSKTAAKDMFGENNVKQNNVVILKNALTLDKYLLFSSIREKYRHEFGIKKDNIVIGMVARFHSQKNHEFMIKIFEKLVSLNNNFVLLLVGGGEEIDKYKKIVDNNDNIRKKVIFTGIRNDVPNLLQAMDLFVLPSKYEGFGNVFLEAQVSGLPTVASTEVPKETKISELITYLSLEKDAKYWAEYIAKLNVKDKKRRNYIEEARQAGFDIKEQAEILENLYITLYDKEN
ncbi:MAG: glycosyltransferase [Halanaerobiales bacterium]|nr:glycosyltransferase [Halanaerobiales bacterium]